MTQMYHAVFREMVDVLDQKLLFGAGDTILGPLMKPDDIVDKLHEHVIGHGVLVSEMKTAWNPIKFIMGNDKLCQTYFYVGPNGIPLPKPAAWEKYLDAVERFKELFYFLFHQLTGMPKRGSEEIRIKIVDTSFRGRNVMYLLNRLACVGDYSKTSRNAGNDKLTLHFFPRVLEMVLRRFQSSVASINAWVIDEVLPFRTVDTHHHCYLFSSKGKRWTSDHLSCIIQTVTAEHLPGQVSLNISSLRHILPGIADHYNISNLLTRADNVLHGQMGHTQDTGDRLYARAVQDHPQLTSSMTHKTMSFCDLWQELFGFDGDHPDEEAALQLQQVYTQGLSSSRKTLSNLWSVQTPPAPVSSNLSRPLQDNIYSSIIGMEQNLSQLKDTVLGMEGKISQLMDGFKGIERMEHNMHQLTHLLSSTLVQGYHPATMASTANSTYAVGGSSKSLIPLQGVAPDVIVSNNSSHYY